ncbi:DegT/DnrJ/EryC1/StrS family aminotransferase [Neptunitalea lumnitzerae]|uniref:Pyridoxal phosphate-dependent aminotransferase n=1 Tax=Neptunitalea lumnitzerae TaxID=2965509 RepID=A0ABQ5MFN9_9FLAO|nr:aminotransferase class I/II-fold pyridoxal phosphate-dependent enzyme [Neptunitalea sp. Y10]GLB48131.1 pyridoxal phosphate-dependent aminotransferase [Neptunitalea sp. Y10]
MTERKKILLSPACTNELEQQYISESLLDHWMAPQGPQCTKFEAELQQYLKTSYIPVLVSSGTAAIHLALKTLGVGAGDIVLVQNFTFAASVNPITYVGAIPVLIDSENSTWNMCPDQLEKAIKYFVSKNQTPKAIITVDLYGMPCNYKRILEISKAYHIPVVEDSAEALGSSYKGAYCGTLADMGIFSFNGNKMITMTSGGLVLCKTEEQATQVRYLANQAKEATPYYEHKNVGYNYAQSNILAAIGRAQLTKLPAFLSKRAVIHTFYSNLFKTYDFVEVMQAPDEVYSTNYWLTCVIIKPNNFNKSNHGLKAFLEKKNIETRYLWKPMHLQPVYQHCKFFSTGVSETVFNMGLCLPSSPVLEEQDLAYLENCIKTYLEQ